MTLVHILYLQIVEICHYDNTRPIVKRTGKVVYIIMYVHTYVRTYVRTYVCMYVHMYVCMLEMQRYTTWVYRYIATCISQYSDILHDTIKCKFTDF